MADFDYGTAEGVHFKIGDKVTIKNVMGKPIIYEVIEFDRTKGAFNGVATNNELKKHWVTLKRVDNDKIQDAMHIENLQLKPHNGGKRRTRHRKHRKAKKTRKSRSRNNRR